MTCAICLCSEQQCYCHVREAFKNVLVPKGVKKDSGKPLLDLIPWTSVYEAARVFNWAVDSGNYPADNWKFVQNAVKRYCSAGIRHFAARMSGELHDPDSKLFHSAHAACCALITVWFDLQDAIPGNKKEQT
jgi:hypothetical protein